MVSIFISHNSLDKPFARKIAADFEKRGIHSWLDESEMDIGDSLIEKIAEGIHDCNFVLALISKRSVTSNWVQKELRLAMTQEVTSGRITVLPAVIEDCYDDLPFYLTDKLYANFSNPSEYQFEFDRIIRSIERKSQTNLSNIKSYVTTGNIGEINVGDLIHDRGDNYRIIRSNEKIQKTCIEFFIQGSLLILLSLVVRYLIPKIAFAAFYIMPIGIAFLLAGSLLKISMRLYLRAYELDPNILVKIESAKPPRFFFSKAWFKQYETGKHIKSFRVANYLEIIGILMVFGSVIIGVFFIFLVIHSVKG